MSWANFRQTLNNYLMESSIHGVKYIAGQHSILTKMLWTKMLLSNVETIMTIGGMSLAGWIVLKANMSWNESPLVTTIDSVSLPTRNIPFPTITVCPDELSSDSNEMVRQAILGLKFNCIIAQDGNDTDCQDTQPLRKLIRPWINKFVKKLYSTFSESFQSASYTNPMDYYALSDLVDKLKSNSLTTDTVLHELSNVLGMTNFPSTSFFRQFDWSRMSLTLCIDVHTDICAISSMIEHLTYNIPVLQDILAMGSIESIVDKFKDSSDIFNHMYVNLRPDSKSVLSTTAPLSHQTMSGDKAALKFNNLTYIMSIMKYHLAHTGVRLAPENMLSLFNITDNLAGFAVQKPNFDKPFVQSNEVFLPTCTDSLNGISAWQLSVCKFFYPVPTAQGICYAMNAKLPSSLIRQGLPFLEAFNTNFEAEYYPLLDAEISNFTGNINPRFFLNTNKLREDKANVVSGSFRLFISNQHTFVDTSQPQQGITIKLGHLNTVYVKPTVKKSHGIDYLDIDKRKCRFLHETLDDEASIFNFYSEQTCIQEYVILNCIKLCKCIPWYWPFSLKVSHLPICDRTGQSCAQLRRLSQLQECRARCLPDCDTLTFEIVRVEHDTPERVFDRIATNNIVFANQEKIRNILQSNFREEDVKALNSDTSSHAFVTVRLSSPTYIQYNQTIQIDTIGRMAYLGGFLGLFCGMSFLSMAELLFWILKCFMAAIQYPTRNTLIL